MRDRISSGTLERFYFTALLSAGLLRFINLGFLDLQAWDEALYAVRAEGILRFGGWIDQTPFSIGGLYSSLHPPLYVWMTSLSFALLGVSEFAARFGSAVCGLFTLFTLYQIGKELESPKVGFVAALLFGLNPFVSFYARQGQFDTLLVLFLSLSMLWYIRLDRDGTMKSAVAAGVASGAALLSKLFVGLSIPLTYILWKAFKAGEGASKWRLFSLSVLGIVVLAAPWHVYMTIAHGFGNPLFLLDASAIFQRSLYGVEGNIQSLESFYFLNQLIVLFPLGVCWFAAGAYAIIRARDRQWLFVVLWFFVFFAVFSLMRTKLAVYTLPMLAPGSLIAARTIVKAGEDDHSPSLTVLLLGSTALTFLWSASQSWRNNVKEIVSNFAHVQAPTPSSLAGVAPLLLLTILFVGLTIIIHRRGWIRSIRPGLPLLVLVPSLLLTLANVFWNDKTQYKDGASELSAFLTMRQPIGIVVVGFDRNPQLTYYLQGADIGWRNDIEVRRMVPPDQRVQFRPWISATVVDLPDETLVIVEKDKIIRYEWFSAEEVAPEHFHLVFDSRRYAVFDRLTGSQLAALRQRETF